MIDAVITDAAEIERYALLFEEASEVIQVVGKILRHGADSSHPQTPRTTNKVLLEDEIADFLLAVKLLEQNGDIDISRVTELVASKKARKNKYLHVNVIK